MTNLSLFFKNNKKTKENIKFIATKSLTDENGKPLEWEMRQITTKEDEEIRESCTIEVQVTGKPNLFRSKCDANKYIAKLICAAIVEPNLYSAELQDSYGVKTPEELIKEIIDNPGEYAELAKTVQDFQGYDETLEEKVQKAKN